MIQRKWARCKLGKQVYRLKCTRCDAFENQSIELPVVFAHRPSLLHAKAQRILLSLFLDVLHIVTSYTESRIQVGSPPRVEALAQNPLFRHFWTGRSDHCVSNNVSTASQTQYWQVLTSDYWTSDVGRALKRSTFKRSSLRRPLFVRDWPSLSSRTHQTIQISV